MILLDSSFIVAYKVEDDQHYLEAESLIKKINSGMYGPILISDYIFDEVITVLFNRTKKLQIAIEGGEELRRAVQMIKIDDKLFEEAWEVFKQQKNTKLSFTDCTILVLMKKRGIKNIATFDEDFKKIIGVNVID